MTVKLARMFSGFVATATATLLGICVGGCDLWQAGKIGLGNERQADPKLPPPSEPYVKVIKGQEVRDMSAVMAANATSAPSSQPQAKASPLDTVRIESVSFSQTPLANAALMLTKMIGQNVIVSTVAGNKPITLYLTDVSARTAIESICRLNDLWYREDHEVIRLLTRQEYGKELVIKEDQQTRLYYLKNASAAGIADMIASLMPDQVEYIVASDESSFGHVGTDGSDPMSNSRYGTSGTNSNSTSSSNSRTNNNTDSDYAATGGRSSNSGVRRTNFGYSATDVASNYQKGLETGKVEELAKESLTRQTGEVSAQDVAEKTGVKAPVTLSVFMRNNCIAVRTVHESVHSEIGKIIESLDTPTRQVLLEVRVLRVNLGDDFQSVFGMSYTTGDYFPQFKVDWLDGADIANNTLSFSFLNSHVSATLKLMKDDNRLHTVATPMLLCANNAPAEFFSGINRPMITNYDYETRYDDNNNAVDIARPVVADRDVGTTVQIRPSINADGTVTMRFYLEMSEVIPKGAYIYQTDSDGDLVALPIDTMSEERAQSIVVANHGQAVVMGGLINESVSKANDRVPLVGDIPVVGTFFGKKVDSTTRTETVMIIVPHIMGNPTTIPDVSKTVLENNSIHPLSNNNRKSITRWDPVTERVEEIDPNPSTSPAPGQNTPPPPAKKTQGTTK